MNTLNKHYLITSLSFICVLVSDIITKHIVETNIMEGQRIYVLGSFVQLTKIYNRGGVFGILQGYQIFFLVVSILVFILLIAFYIHEKNKSLIFSFAMGLVFAGAIGNIIDRVANKPGVVDFIYIGVEDVFMWPAFNIADMSIVCGAILLGFVFWQQEKQNNTNPGNQPSGKSTK